MPLDVSEVTFDIDKLKVEDDDINDIKLDVPVTHSIEGQAVLKYTGCGAYDVEYTVNPDTLTVNVDRDAILARIQFACDTEEIESENRCNNLIRAATGLNDGLTVTLDAEEINAVALMAVETSFDTGWCRL